MLDAINNNSLLRKLFSIKQVDEENLKVLYRKLCKKTHPDLNGGRSEDFLKVKSEYEQALDFLKKMKGFKFEHIESEETSPLNPRLGFIRAFYYYHAVGLHSIKIRLKEELKERNREIMKRVIHWANLYDRSFIPIFLNYNRSYLLTFNMWRNDKVFKVGREHFLTGLSWFFDYQRIGTDSYHRVTASYLDDALCEMHNMESTPYRAAIIEMLKWLVEELKLPPILMDS